MVLQAITEIVDFATFNYDLLYTDNKLFQAFISPYVPFISVLLYLLLSKPLCTLFVSVFNVKPNNHILKIGIVVHSTILAIYSGWTFVNVAFILYRYYNGKRLSLNLFCCANFNFRARRCVEYIVWLLSKIVG